jgi:penicillin-binding protein 1A
MPIKLVCPGCSADVPLREPLPLPGARAQCPACASPLAVTYPAGVMAALKARGKRFADQPVSTVQALREDVVAMAAAGGSGRAHTVPSTVMGTTPAPQPRRQRRVAPRAERRARTVPTEMPTERFEPAGPADHDPTEFEPTAVDPTMVDEDDGPRFFELDRTVPSARSPYGALADNAPEPEGHRPALPAEDDPTSYFDDDDSLEPVVDDPRADAMKTSKKGLLGGAMGCMGSMGALTAGGVVLAALAGVGGYYGVKWHYTAELPTIETLRSYDPPTVTVVEDRNGEILGEIFEQRRYVVPVEEMPDHVKNAFLAAEDANFYNHDGIDYMGIARAILRNAAAGKKAQGASTITQQVARNFLLTRDKRIERKIKEIFLSWRIEDAYTKDHILYLYLNEIFLGSQAYGVEAASRAYYGKSVKDISIAEAAILAGLPQRPSDYSPHRHFDKAKGRQGYVLRQMLEKGYITQAQHDEAVAEQITITPRGNAFLEQAPYFTEHVRRYLVDKYGEEAVLNGGLKVRTTCDLDLQRVAQEAVTTNVDEVDQRMGFRRQGITNVGAAGVKAKAEALELAMREAWAYEQDPAGRVPLPEVSTLEEGGFYEAVITETNKSWVKVAIGAHEAIIPLAWSKWVYEPNPKRSWRYRDATDLTAEVDTDEDGKPDAPILQVGDVVEVKVDHLSTLDDDVSKAFKGTPGATKAYVAARLWQEPEVEAAMLSMDVATGAVRAMVGGADFRKSQFNRAIQSRRQVGSTFKPIVYAAAIESQRVTAATLVADAPLAFATSEEFIWKPSNYSHEYEGNMTLRQALAASKNTCTVRVLEATDPGMNDDVVYNFARRLGIGGPPLHALPDDWVPTRENDLLCPWTRETKDSTICMDRYPPIPEGMTNTRHRANLKPDDVYWCRACDMSMGLGSASLTMEEMVRAYSAFASGGHLVEPYYVEEVRGRDGSLLESHEPREFPQVMDPAVASIATWLMEGVVHGGTGHRAWAELRLQGLAGKTGTTNEEKDTWFVGFTNDVITASWVGYDQPRSLGVSSTGGRTALPIWIDYMREAAPKENDRPFPMRGEVEWASIDEKTGRRVSGGGVRYPFVKDTAPESSGLKAGQVAIEDLSTDL